MSKPCPPVIEDESVSTAYLRAPAGRSHAEISRLLLESITDYLSNNPRPANHDGLQDREVEGAHHPRRLASEE